MKIAILYICTGRYTVFWPEFYASCEKFFFPGHRKEYFVFTDGSITPAPKNARLIMQACMGWPYDTLQRFKLFETQKNILAQFDLVFFCNANVEFMRPVGREILPPTEDTLIVAQHPGYINATPEKFQFERNPASRAYIEEGRGEVYVCGGFNGGSPNAYLHMIQTLNKNIQRDMQEGIIARWHDESHLNRYILDHPYFLLPVNYCYPEYDKSFDTYEVVRIREKIRYGGALLLRNQPMPLIVWLREKVRCLAARAGLLPHIRKLLQKMK